MHIQGVGIRGPVGRRTPKINASGRETPKMITPGRRRDEYETRLWGNTQQQRRKLKNLEDFNSETLEFHFQNFIFSETRTPDALILTLEARRQNTVRRRAP